MVEQLFCQLIRFPDLKFKTLYCNSSSQSLVAESIGKFLLKPQAIQKEKAPTKRKSFSRINLINGGIDFYFSTFMMEGDEGDGRREDSMHPRNVSPPSYSPVGWFSPLNSINFHFPNLISWIFSISLSPPALRIIPRDDIFQCCSQAIGEIITNSFCRQNMAFRRKGNFFSKVLVGNY